MTQVRASTAVDGAPRTQGLAVVILGVTVLSASYCINAMDRTLFPLMLTDVRREFAFALPQAGLMSTIFTVGMALAGIPTGLLMARCSRKTVIQIGIAIYSAATIITVVAVGFADMLLYRAITGIGEAMQLTALLAVFSSYFWRYPALGVGIVNGAYGGGAVLGPALGTAILVGSGTWRAPMFAFGLLGFLMMCFIALFVRPWMSEATARAATARSSGGAARLLNPNTILLTFQCVLFGLSLYGYLGMYPTFLREHLHFAPSEAGQIMSVYGFGVLASVVMGWLGDRFSSRLVLFLSFLSASILSYLLFNGPTDFWSQLLFSLGLGATFSGTIYVNLAGGLVKSVTADLGGKAMGLFVTSLYTSASAAGYLIGWIVGLSGWTTAGNIQLALFCLVGAAASLAIRSDRMAAQSA
jgi:MFS transporter, DHA1 family, inner membrane transport protein